MPHPIQCNLRRACTDIYTHKGWSYRMGQNDLQDQVWSPARWKHCVRDSNAGRRIEASDPPTDHLFHKTASLYSHRALDGFVCRPDIHTHGLYALPDQHALLKEAHVVADWLLGGDHQRNYASSHLLPHDGLRYVCVLWRNPAPNRYN